jgi:hypothetical protein
MQYFGATGEFYLIFAPWTLFFVLPIGSGRARRSHASDAIYRAALGLTLAQDGVARSSPYAAAGPSVSELGFSLASPVSWPISNAPSPIEAPRPPPSPEVEDIWAFSDGLERFTQGNAVNQDP